MKLSKPKKILIIIAALLAVFLILDFNYFAANFNFIVHRQQFAYLAEHRPAQSQTEPNVLSIPSLGITAPVIYVDQKSEKVYQAALINGVVHYPGTAKPGEFGNVYIFGHSSDYMWSKGHYKNIFALLPRMQNGEEIQISDQQGKQFRYLVTDSRKVAANDVSVLSQQNYEKKLLTLQASYPVGTALARWVVVAEIKK